MRSTHRMESKMPAKVYAVTLHVTEGNLGTVLQTIVGSATLVSVVPTQETARSSGSSSSSGNGEKHVHYVGGKRNKGISGEDLVMQTLGSSAKVFNMNEITNAFCSHFLFIWGTRFL